MQISNYRKWMDGWIDEMPLKISEVSVLVLETTGLGADQMWFMCQIDIWQISAWLESNPYCLTVTNQILVLEYKEESSTALSLSMQPLILVIRSFYCVESSGGHTKMMSSCLIHPRATIRLKTSLSQMTLEKLILTVIFSRLDLFNPSVSQVPPHLDLVQNAKFCCAGHYPLPPLASF